VMCLNGWIGSARVRRRAVDANRTVGVSTYD
jgi:hypothetical protein